MRAHRARAPGHKKADAIICTSRDEAERQVTAYSPAAAGRVVRVSPGVTINADAATDPTRALIRPLLTEPHKPIALAIARPVAKKNLRALKQAYVGSGVLQQAANLVILAGQRTCTGDQRTETARVTTELFNMVDRANLWSKVALPRSHTAEQVQGLYRHAAEGGVFVNPAHHEPFGLTVVEALQHAVPVVATRRGGPLEVLETAGYGTPIDPNDTAAIAGACLQIMQDPARAARETATAEYAWDRRAGDVCQIMRRIVSGRTAMT